MNKLILFALSFFAFTIIGCTNNDLEVNTADIEVNVKIKRFDKDIRNLKTFDYNIFTKLKNEYGYFLDVFGNIVLEQPITNPNYINILQSFVQDAYIKEIDESIDKVFTDQEITNLKIELEESFKHYKYYYPDSTIPTIITYNSAFNYAVSTLDNSIAIGLDLYLGKDAKYYDLNGFPKYKSVNMDKKYIARDCMKAWAMHNLYPVDENQKDLLSQIVYNGKILYFLDAMFPDREDAWKLSYTDEQLQWCIKNEPKIWAFFIEKNELFSTDLQNNFKYTSDAPFTSGLPQESPGRVGNWVGWQIVKKYMDKNSKTTLLDLMKEQNAQKILQVSGYKPK